MMSNELPQNAAKIANDYLDRLSGSLMGMPLTDRRELLDEIKSHIYDAYGNENAGDEVDRILTVLRRLGDPADVISSRMPQAVGRLGRGKKAPMYILAGSLIALFGVPLGLGAVALLTGLMTALFALLVAFYGAGISLVVGGFLSSIICLIAATSPGILDRFNYAVGMEVLRIGPMPFVRDPQLAAIIALIISLLLGVLGLLLLWSGKYVWRGFRFVGMLIIRNVKDAFNRLLQSKPIKAGLFRASMI
jgi:uncharacterized membrane protein